MTHDDGNDCILAAMHPHKTNVKVLETRAVSFLGFHWPVYWWLGDRKLPHGVVMLDRSIIRWLPPRVMSGYPSRSLSFLWVVLDLLDV